MSDDILTILSAFGKVTFKKYKEIYNMLLKHYYGDNEEIRIQHTPNKVMEDLEILGHCEIDYKTRHIIVCPPSMALLPLMGMPIAILSGGRTTSYLEKLDKLMEKHPEKIHIVKKYQTNVPEKIFPPIIYIQALNIKVLRRLAEILKVEFQSNHYNSWEILAVTKSVNEVIKSLEFNRTGTIPNWQRKIFDIDSLYFREKVDFQEIRLENYIHAHTQQQITLLWNGNESVEVDKNWGRYIILSMYDKKILLYDKLSQKFAVPLYVPLPTQFKKVLSLCLGCLPDEDTISKKIGDIPKESKIKIYYGIPDFIVKDISKKLGLEIVEANL